MKSSPSLLKLFCSSSKGFTLLEQAIFVAVVGILAVIAAPNVTAMLNRMKVEQAMTEVRNALNETQREAVRSNKVCSVTLNFIDGEISGPCLVTGNRQLPAEVGIATNLIPDAAITNSIKDTEESPVVTNAVVAKAPPVVLTDAVPDLGLSAKGNVQIAMLSLKDQDPEAPEAAMMIQIISDAGGNCKSKGKGIKHCLSDRKDDDDDDDGGGSSPPNPGGSPTVAAREIPVQFGVLGNPKFAIATPAGTALPTDPSGKIVLFLPTSQKATKKCIAISQSLGLTRIGNYEGPLTPSDITTQGTCTAVNWTKQ